MGFWCSEPDAGSHLSKGPRYFSHMKLIMLMRICCPCFEPQKSTDRVVERQQFCSTLLDMTMGCFDGKSGRVHAITVFRSGSRHPSRLQHHAPCDSCPPGPRSSLLVMSLLQQQARVTLPPPVSDTRCGIRETFNLQPALLHQIANSCPCKCCIMVRMPDVAAHSVDPGPVTLLCHHFMSWAVHCCHPMRQSQCGVLGAQAWTEQEQHCSAPMLCMKTTALQVKPIASLQATTHVLPRTSHLKDTTTPVVCLTACM